MKVSIVVPAHDEEENILNKLSSLYKSDHVKVKVVHKAGRKCPLGSALVFGFECATGEIFIPFMGDLSDDPNDVLRCIAKIEEGNIRRNKYLRITVFIGLANGRKASASAYSTCFQGFPEQ